MHDLFYIHISVFYFLAPKRKLQNNQNSVTLFLIPFLYLKTDTVHEQERFSWPAHVLPSQQTATLCTGKAPQMPLLVKSQQCLASFNVLSTACTSWNWTQNIKGLTVQKWLWWVSVSFPLVYVYILLICIYHSRKRLVRAITYNSTNVWTG